MWLFAGSVVVERVIEKGGNIGFDAYNMKYVDMFEAGIIDPTKVSRKNLISCFFSLPRRSSAQRFRTPAAWPLWYVEIETSLVVDAHTTAADDDRVRHHRAAQARAHACSADAPGRWRHVLGSQCVLP